MRKLALALILFAAPVLATEPYTTTLSTETGTTPPHLTAAQYDGSIRALRNFFTQTVTNYSLFFPQGNTPPGTCSVGQAWIDSDATASSRLLLCTSSNTWTAVGAGGVGDITGVGSCASGQCDSFTLATNTEPMLVLNNNASGTALKSIFALQRAGNTRWQFGVGDDSLISLFEADGSTGVWGIAYSTSDSVLYIGTEAGHDMEMYAAAGSDLKLTEADGAILSNGGLTLVPSASPPFTCNGAHEGAMYSDTSHALCWCDASTWQKVFGAGTCS